MLTRQDLIFKWSIYGAAALLLSLFYTLLLRDVRILGVSMFLPPLVPAIVASVEEDTRSAVIFGMAAGVLCDLTLPGTFPCVYTLSFTLASLFCSLLAKSVLQPGPICSVAVTVLTFLIMDLFNMLALGLRDHAPLLSMADLFARETAASCLLLFLCHPVLLFLHRRFTL